NGATLVRGSYPSSTPSSTGGSVSRDRPSRSAPAAQAELSAAAENATALGLKVFTVAEAASVLRVDVNVIVTAISSGELPGNRIGNHWRIDQDALRRWLQGRYGTIADPSGSPSSTESRTDPG